MSKSNFQINHYRIGPGEPPFIIAEAGLNHNGELEKAFEMIKVVKASGASAIKFQTYRADELVADRELMWTYESQGKPVTESQYDMFKRYELSRDEWFAVKKKCDDEEILFLSTPQNYSDLELLLELGIAAIKVGSDDFNNLPLLKKYASTQLPMMVSCGMADMAEVFQALETIGTFDGYPTVLFLCTSQYPTPPQDVNLKKLDTLSHAFPMAVMGFSDHTKGPLASSLAVAKGACVFEKHFTLDHNLPGPDHSFSEDPESLEEWVSSIQTAHQMLGSSIVRPTHGELEVRKGRRSIVAVQEIQAGDTFTEQNIAMRRPNTGLPPAMYEDVLGKQASRNIIPSEPICLGDVR